jgi:hypothetical protein
VEKEKLKRLAARLVAEGFRKAECLSKEAWRERRMADLLPEPDKEALQIQAAAKFEYAARVRQLCGRLAAAHDIGPKRTGQGSRPRPVQRNSTAVLKRKVAYAR